MFKYLKTKYKHLVDDQSPEDTNDTALSPLYQERADMSVNTIADILR